MSDILYVDEGTVVLLTHGSRAGQAWLAENVQTEAWQRLGCGIGVEHRYADPILEGAVEAGLSVGTL